MRCGWVGACTLARAVANGGRGWAGVGGGGAIGKWGRGNADDEGRVLQGRCDEGTHAVGAGGEGAVVVWVWRAAVSRGDAAGAAVCGSSFDAVAGGVVLPER